MNRVPGQIPASEPDAAARTSQRIVNALALPGPRVAARADAGGTRLRLRALHVMRQGSARGQR
jgi:hypothetical protein